MMLKREIITMFARISTYKMKPESIAEAEAKVQKLLPTILGMDGMVTFTNVIDAEGNGVVVSVVESETHSNANAEQVAKIWSEFSDYLLGPPEVNGYRVIVHESN
jgi:hypothetical protein